MAKSAPAVLPEPGSVYGFQTKHSFDWKSEETGRFGAFKFIGIHREDTPVIIVFDGVFDQMPTLEQVKDLPILHLNRGAFNNKPEIRGIYNFERSKLEPFDRLGVLPVSAEETQMAEDCRTFSGMGGMGISLEHEWQSINHPEAYAADIERYSAQQQAKREAAQAHYNTRLKGLTFETLLSETLFEKWTPSPPCPPAEFITEARAELRRLMEELQGMMTPKPKKAAARKAIRATVEKLNEMDLRYGHVIETVEREDLHEALAEITHAAKHPKLADEIENWRDW